MGLPLYQRLRFGFELYPLWWALNAERFGKVYRLHFGPLTFVIAL